MLVRYLSIFLLLSLVTGCSATRQPTQVSQLQIKVAQLERKLEERDQEVNELRYEVKDLTVQLDSLNDTDATSENYDYYADADYESNYKMDEPIEEPQSESRISKSDLEYKGGFLNDPSKDDRIIRVEASVKQVQTALKNAGYYNGSIDGKLGRKSKRAIKDFQKENSLVADGIIGRKTWSELKNFLD